MFSDDETENQSESELNDSVVFVDEYIDCELDAPKTTKAVKTEPAQQEQQDLMNSQEQEASSTVATMVKIEPIVDSAEVGDDVQDIKPATLPSALLIPVAMKEEPENNSVLNASAETSTDQSE